MSLDPRLVAVLACPVDKGPLYYLGDEGGLYNPRLRRRYLVRRSHMITIVAAWIITVPVTGIIAAALAWASAESAHTVTKLFSVASCVLMRCSMCSVSSTLDSSPWRNAVESSARVLLCIGLGAIHVQ